MGERKAQVMSEQRWFEQVNDALSHVAHCPNSDGLHFRRQDFEALGRLVEQEAQRRRATEYVGCAIDRPLLPVRDPFFENTEKLPPRRDLIYWLLRAYQSGHREGWESGPSSSETMERICDVLANAGYDPSSEQAKRLLEEHRP